MSRILCSRKTNKRVKKKKGGDDAYVLSTFNADRECGEEHTHTHTHFVLPWLSRVNSINAEPCINAKQQNGRNCAQRQFNNAQCENKKKKEGSALELPDERHSTSWTSTTSTSVFATQAQKKKLSIPSPPVKSSFLFFLTFVPSAYSVCAATLLSHTHTDIYTRIMNCDHKNRSGFRLHVSPRLPTLAYESYGTAVMSSTMLSS